MLKSPIMHAFIKTIGLMLHNVENNVSNNEVLEPGGR